MRFSLVSGLSGLKISHKIWGLAGFLIAANVAVVATMLFRTIGAQELTKRQREEDEAKQRRDAIYRNRVSTPV